MAYNWCLYYSLEGVGSEETPAIQSDRNQETYLTGIEGASLWRDPHWNMGGNINTYQQKNIHIFFLNILEQRLDDKEETESFICPESYSHCTIMVVKQDDLF